MGEIPERLQLIYYLDEARIFNDVVIPEISRDYPIEVTIDDDLETDSSRFDIECRSTDIFRRALCYFAIGISVEKHILSKRKK
jgi:hypothetical protein